MLQVARSVVFNVFLCCGEVEVLVILAMLQLGECFRITVFVARLIIHPSAFSSSPPSLRDTHPRDQSRSVNNQCALLPQLVSLRVIPTLSFPGPIPTNS